MNSSAVSLAKPSSKGMTTSSRTPSPSITSRLTLKGISSFGSASGWITESGCGSKVSTVSAPSITARWPLWTPSKVPIATWRGRGSASGSEVTSMFGISLLHYRRASPAAGTSSPTRSRPIHQLPILPLLADVLDPEGADRRPPQLRAVGVVEGLEQGSDVGAGRALDLIAGLVALMAEQLGAVDVDLAFGGVDDLAAVGLLIEALAADADGRGHRQLLADGAGRQTQRVGEASGLGQLAVGVAGARAPAQLRGRQVGLRQPRDEALDAGRPPEQDEQQPGGEGVEGPGVSRLAPALASDPRNHVVRGYPGGLVAEQQRALAGPGIRSRAGPRPRRRGTGSAPRARGRWRSRRRACGRRRPGCGRSRRRRRRPRWSAG